MEDARFVRFVDDDGSVTFYATYTAYSGSHISQQLLETTDFRSFTSAPMVGPRRGQQGSGAVSSPDSRSLRGHVEIGPRIEHDCLLRSSVRLAERASLPAARPEPGRRCNSGTAVRPSKPTPGGWCSPTASARCAPTASGRSCSISTIRHGLSVSYRQPLLSPATDEQDGYVPNVVYSCGALVHADTLVLPYGIGDAAIGVATVPLPELLAALSS